MVFTTKQDDGLRVEVVDLRTGSNSTLISGIDEDRGMGEPAEHIFPSPSGSTIALLISDSQGQKLLYLASLDTRQILFFRQAPGIHNPQWSPDGKRLAFDYRDDNEDKASFEIVSAEGSILLYMKLPSTVNNLLGWTWCR
jgi:Tol biopolymer transport system component